MSLRGKAAMVGFGELPSVRSSLGRTSAAMLAEACGIAIRDAAVARLTLEQETFTALEMPFEAARCLLEQAAAAVAWQPKAAALLGRAARESLATFEHLGA